MTDAPTLDRIVLGYGSHKMPPGGIGGDVPVEACINEALAIKWAAQHNLDLAATWTDNLSCMDPAIRSALMGCNDRMGQGPAADERRRVVLGPLYEDGVGLGTRGTAALSARRKFMLADWSIRSATPRLLRLTSLVDWAVKLEALPVIASEAALREARQSLYGARDDVCMLRNTAYEKLRKAAAAAAAAAVEVAVAVAAVAVEVEAAVAVEAVAAVAVAAVAAEAEAAAAAVAVAAGDLKFTTILAAAQKAHEGGGGYWDCYWAAKKVAEEIGYVVSLRPQLLSLRDELDAEFVALIRRCAAMAEEP